MVGTCGVRSSGKSHPCMPESVKDRPTSRYEHVFLLAKSERYFYDATPSAKPAAPTATVVPYLGDSRKPGKWQRDTSPDQQENFATIGENDVTAAMCGRINHQAIPRRTLRGHAVGACRTMRTGWHVRTWLLRRLWRAMVPCHGTYRRGRYEPQRQLSERGQDGRVPRQPIATRSSLSPSDGRLATILPMQRRCGPLHRTRYVRWRRHHGACGTQTRPRRHPDRTQQPITSGSPNNA